MRFNTVNIKTLHYGILFAFFLIFLGMTKEKRHPAEAKLVQAMDKIEKDNPVKAIAILKQMLSEFPDKLKYGGTTVGRIASEQLSIAECALVSKQNRFPNTNTLKSALLRSLQSNDPYELLTLLDCNFSISDGSGEPLKISLVTALDAQFIIRYYADMDTASYSEAPEQNMAFTSKTDPKQKYVFILTKRPKGYAIIGFAKTIH